jgi:hypothetical protein
VIDAVIDGRTYRFDEDDVFDHGGEADVYRFYPDPEFTRRHGNAAYVIKIFREDTEVQRRAARERQTKLRSFPQGLPANVVTPTALAYDLGRTKVIGYVMAFVPDATKLIEFKTRDYRVKHRVTTAQICRILVNLYDLVVAIHARGIVIGDFNDKNVLVGPNFEVYLIDADSLQYGSWECPAFVAGFVDPLICARPDPTHPKSFTALRKVHPHSTRTDWYAFSVIVFQLFMFAHPYMSGLHHPAKGEGPRRKGVQRIHRRLSVFHPRVGAQQSMTPLENLPDPLSTYFFNTFVRDVRGSFPRELLSPNLWTICGSCRTLHGRVKCPSCGAPGVANATTQSRRLNGRILAVAPAGDKTRCVYHEGGAYRREGGIELWRRAHDDRLSALVAGDRTVFASGSSFVLFNGHRPPERRSTQCVYGKTTVAANSRHVYWIHGSELVRDDGHSGPTTIGTIARNTTSIWTGERFGLALAQGGVLSKVLTFSASGQGMLGSYSLPLEFGTVIDAQCVINDDLAWLKVTSRTRKGTIVHRCYVFDAYGRLLARTVGRQGELAWLDQFNSSALALRSKLIVPVRRAGMVQIGIKGNELRQEMVHHGTEPLTQEATVGLYAHNGGILHASTTSITPITVR